VGVSPAFSATPSQRELVFNAGPLLQRESPNADSTVGHQLSLRPNKADSVALMRRPFTAMKRAKREPTEQRQCVGSGRWKI
jgi:hypothetical protein